MRILFINDLLTYPFGDNFNCPVKSSTKYTPKDLKGRALFFVESLWCSIERVKGKILSLDQIEGLRFGEREKLSIYFKRTKGQKKGLLCVWVNVPLTMKLGTAV